MSFPTINIDKFLKLNKNYSHLYNEFILDYDKLLDMEDHIINTFNYYLHMNDETNTDVKKYIKPSRSGYSNNYKINLFYENIDVVENAIEELIDKTDDIKSDFDTFLEKYTKIIEIEDATLKKTKIDKNTFTGLSRRRLITYRKSVEEQQVESQADTQSQTGVTSDDEDMKKGGKLKKIGGSAINIRSKIDESRFDENADVIYKERNSVKKKSPATPKKLIYLQINNTTKAEKNLINLAEPKDSDNDSKVIKYLLIMDIIHDIKEIRISNTVSDYHGLFLIKDSFDKIIIKKNREISQLFNNVISNPNDLLVSPETVAMNYLFKVNKDDLKLSGNFSIINDDPSSANTFDLDIKKYNYSFVDMLGENMEKRLLNFDEHSKKRKRASIGTLLDESPITVGDDTWVYPTNERLIEEIKIINENIIPTIQSLFNDLEIFQIKLQNKISNDNNTIEKYITNLDDFKTLPNNKDINVFYFTIALKSNPSKTHIFRWKRVGVAKLKKLILFKDENELIIKDLISIFTTEKDFYDNIDINNNIVSIINSIIFMWKTLGDYSQSYLANIPSTQTIGGYKFKKLNNKGGSTSDEEATESFTPSKKQRKHNPDDIIKTYFDHIINTRLLPMLSNEGSSMLSKEVKRSKSNLFISGDRICAAVAVLNSNNVLLNDKDIIIYHSTKNNAFIYEKNSNYFNDISVVELLNNEYDQSKFNFISLVYNTNKLEIKLNKTKLENYIGVDCEKPPEHIVFELIYDKNIINKTYPLSNKIKDYTNIKNYIEDKILYILIYRYNNALTTWFNIDDSHNYDDDKMVEDDGTDYNTIALINYDEKDENSYLRQKNNINKILKESNKIYDSINKFTIKLKNNLKTVKKCYGRLIYSDLHTDTDNISIRTISKILNFTKDIKTIFQYYNKQNDSTKTLNIIDKLIEKIKQIKQEVIEIEVTWKTFNCSYIENSNFELLKNDIQLYIDAITGAKNELSKIINDYLSEINIVIDKIKQKSEADFSSAKETSELIGYFELYKEFHEKIKTTLDFSGGKKIKKKNKTKKKLNIKKNNKTKKELNIKKKKYNKNNNIKIKFKKL